VDAGPIVFLLDDDESVVLALGRLLQSQGFATRAWTSAARFLAEHDPDQPGCLVSDLSMPEMDGLQLQQALLEADCRRPIIFLTGYGDMATAVTGMRAGAVSFLPKPVRVTELVAAVREGIARDADIRVEVQERHRVLELMQKITPRERQVLELVVQGLLNKQIAAQLGTAEKTIKVHRGRLMHKMRVKSAAALVKLLDNAALSGAGKLSSPSRWSAASGQTFAYQANDSKAG
jgi:FixJ family two-component response regulator